MSVADTPNSGEGRPSAGAAPVSFNLEREVKLEGAPEALDKAFAELGAGASPGPARTLLSIYFDTPGGALWAHGMSLRIRKSQGKYVQTLKWSEEGADADTRGEAEAPCPSSDPDFSLFGPEVREELERITDNVPLLARFSSQVKRRIAVARAGDAQIEAAYDIGAIIDGDTQLPVREIELELKEGDPSNLYAFAEQLSAAYNLRLGVLTKSQRGYLLASGEPTAVRKAEPVHLAPDSRLDDLIAAALQECVDHFVLNWPVLLQSDKPEAIHQMRVGIRRLRAMLKLFSKDIPNPRLDAYRAEARDIASALGVARDTDVFIEMMEAGPLQGREPDKGIEALRAAAQERREEGYGQAHAMLAAPQTTRFVLELRGFIARRGWREGLDAEPMMRLGEPAMKFAERTIARLDRRARKMSKTVQDADAEQRHALRIVLKNLRYSIDMFAPMFAARGEAKKFAKIVALLQDVLGEYNDAAVAAGIVADLERRAGSSAGRAAGLVLGWTARGLEAAPEHLAFELKDFRKAKRFWT